MNIFIICDRYISMSHFTKNYCKVKQSTKTRAGKRIVPINIQVKKYIEEYLLYVIVILACPINLLTTSTPTPRLISVDNQQKPVLVNVLFQ